MGKTFTLTIELDDETRARAEAAFAADGMTMEADVAAFLAEGADFAAVDALEKEEGYDEWFIAQIQEALDDPRPGIPHAKVMAELDVRFAVAVRGKR